MSAPMLLGGIVALVTWAVLVFGGITTTGVTHLLLALGITALVRWWALRA